MFVVGLTGGIGSGKSTVADLFAAQGVPVIDTDVIARVLTQPDGEALPAIRDAFGTTVFAADGTLDRAALRRVVFADPAARQRLEAILHPRIRERVAAALLRLSAPYALVVIPLLVETGAYRDLLQRVLVVDCAETEQVERVMRRSGLSRAEIAAILAAQASRGERLAAADDIVVNTASPDALAPQVAALHQRYRVLAGARSP
jgi:dephospho-CoA kinase